MTITMAANNAVANTVNVWMGGCLAVGTTNPIVCFWGKSVDLKSGATGTGNFVQYSALVPSYTAAKNYSTTVAITSTTEITAAKWNRVMSGIDCSATQAAGSGGSGAAPTGSTTCATSAFTADATTGASWFQPKEISTKVYTTLTRFSAKESATWTGMVQADGKKNASGCTAKLLTGASALAAGAAVAFGAAALAF